MGRPTDDATLGVIGSNTSQAEDISRKNSIHNFWGMSLYIPTAYVHK